MERYSLKKDSLRELFKVFKDYELFAPVRRGEATLFELVSDPDGVALDLEHQPLPAKKIILPQTEVLFSFDKKGTPKEPDFRGTQKKRLVFGIRPCDARSFGIIDPVFEQEEMDPYYHAKRENTVLAGLQCSHPFPNCFCTSVGGNPSSSEGLDLLFFDCDEAFLIDVLTDKGAEVIRGASSLLSSASAEQEAQKEKLVREAEREIQRNIVLDGIPQKMEDLFENPLWEEMARPCISCGICTYTCPTCYCFDIQDEKIKGKVKRVRVWDSCMFSEYTLHASGHNPRPTRAERLRNRMYHKFKHNIERYGVAGCVGCGRCITWCPANEDLIDNLRSIGSVS